MNDQKGINSVTPVMKDESTLAGVEDHLIGQSIPCEFKLHDSETNTSYDPSFIAEVVAERSRHGSRTSFWDTARDIIAMIYGKAHEAVDGAIDAASDIIEGGKKVIVAAVEKTAVEKKAAELPKKGIENYIDPPRTEVRFADVKGAPQVETRTEGSAATRPVVSEEVVANKNLPSESRPAINEDHGKKISFLPLNEKTTVQGTSARMSVASNSGEADESAVEIAGVVKKNNVNGQSPVVRSNDEPAEKTPAELFKALYVANVSTEVNSNSSSLGGIKEGGPSAKSAYSAVIRPVNNEREEGARHVTTLSSGASNQAVAILTKHATAIFTQTVNGKRVGSNPFNLLPLSAVIFGGSPADIAVLTRPLAGCMVYFPKVETGPKNIHEVARAVSKDGGDIPERITEAGEAPSGGFGGSTTGQHDHQQDRG